jgi:hypothetical protein
MATDINSKKLGTDWTCLHKTPFVWKVATEGYQIVEGQHQLNLAALMSLWRSVKQCNKIKYFQIIKDDDFKNGVQSAIEGGLATQIAPIAENPVFREEKPLRSLHNHNKREKLLFEHFRDVDARENESIVNFANKFGLLIDHEYSQHNTRKFELKGNKLSFFKREVRDFQEIFNLKEVLTQSEENVKAYLEAYFQRRFQGDDSKFKGFEKDFVEIFHSKREGNLIIIDNEVREKMTQFLEKNTEPSKNDDDPYYLNDYLTYQKEHRGYPFDGSDVTDLDFRDYLQKKEEEVSPKKIGYYYLNKWLSYKFTRFEVLPEAVPNDEGKLRTLYKPQSLLGAIYLQLSDSLSENPSIVYCPLCEKYDIRAHTPEDEIQNEAIAMADWKDHLDDEGGFAYHQQCAHNLQKWLREHEITPNSLSNAEWKRVPKSPQSIKLGPRKQSMLKNECNAHGQDAALQLLRKMLEDDGWL